MNKKLIAAAVAGAVAGPAIMSAAGADVSVYGALYPRITVSDGNVTFADGASRFGFKSSKDMGNGNTVAGVIEVGVDVGNGKMASADKSRLANVSYSGDWGSLLLGSGWSIDNAKKACWNSGQTCNQVGYQGRVADMVQITGDVGGFSVSAQLEADGTDSHSAWGIATGLDVGSVSIGAFYRNTDAASTTHIGAGTTLAGVKLGVEFGDSSAGTDSWAMAAKISGIAVTMDEGSDGNQDVSANYNIDLGGSTLRLIIADNEPADTMLGVQWNYAL